MNLSTKALEDFKEIQGYPAISMLCTGLEQSVKFLLPHPKQINIAVDMKALSFIKLPYPIVAFEFKVPEEPQAYAKPGLGELYKSTKRIALAFKRDAFDFSLLSHGSFFKERLTEDAIVVAAIYELPKISGLVKAAWSTALGVAILDTKDITSINILQDTYEVQGAMFVPFSESSFSQYGRQSIIKDYVNKSNIIHIINNDTGEELCTAIKAIVAMNAKNVTALDIPASPALNKKRKLSGKIEFFSYKVLDIFLAGQTRRSRLDSKVLHSSLAGTLRLHSVRGHFKVRKTGVFWWNSYIKGQGPCKISKDYNLK